MNQDLKNRIPVAIGYVLVIAAMTYLGQWPSFILMVAFYFLCLTEFLNHSFNFDRTNSNKGLTIQSLIWLFVFLICYYLSTWIVALPLLIIFSLIGFSTVCNNKNFIAISNVHYSSSLYITIPFALTSSMIFLYPNFPIILLGIFIILWINDAGAYFVGKAIGKHKLVPSISPNKTIEGFLGGGIAGCLIAILIPYVFDTLDVKSWIILSIAIWLSGSIGDIVESSWKRSLNIKDSGTLMKGHGGFLDRLDSFIYAIPFAIVLIKIFELQEL